MKFYHKKPSKNWKKQVRDFVKIFDVRVHFTKKGGSSAILDKLIEIDEREAYTVQTLWSSVFHELAHVKCYRENKYKKYHKDELSSKKMAIYVRKHGLRIERYVDKVGSEMMKDYLPNMPFLGCYSDELDVKWYKKWVKRNYPL